MKSFKLTVLMVAALAVPAIIRAVAIPPMDLTFSLTMVDTRTITSCHTGDKIINITGDGNAQILSGDCKLAVGRTGEARRFTQLPALKPVKVTNMAKSGVLDGPTLAQMTGLAVNIKGKQSTVLLVADELTQQLATQEGRTFEPGKVLVRLYTNLAYAGQRKGEFTERFGHITNLNQVQPGKQVQFQVDQTGQSFIVWGSFVAPDGKQGRVADEFDLLDPTAQQ